MTLGLVFVSLTLLAFANVIVGHSETSEERIKEFGESERLYNLDNSVSRTRYSKWVLEDQTKKGFPENYDPENYDPIDVIIE